MQSHNQPYQKLEALPRATWMPALTCSAGNSGQRLAHLKSWEQALLSGRVPAPALHLGDPQAAEAVLQVLAELALNQLTQGSAAITEQVLRNALWHLDHLIDRPVHEDRRETIARMQQALRGDWQNQRHDLEAAKALLKTLGDMPHMRWDELQGLLRSHGWAQAERIGALLAQLKDLSQFIDRLGRAERQLPTPPRSAPQAAPSQQRTQALEAVVTHLAGQPGEIRGVRRAGELARMLPSQALMIRHPQLARLWRARFAERALLCYESEAVSVQWRVKQQAAPTTTQNIRTPLHMGPMIVCLDTSGSMRGAPENVAKACVLQAIRSAVAAQRACMLLAFGGRGELLEQALGSSVAGLHNLLAVMGQSFEGGTDVQTPLERAIALVQAESSENSQGLALADVLIVSDGEFGVTPANLALLRKAKQQLGLQVHSILIGDRETIGLLEVSDSIHWVRDWRRYASDAKQAYADGFSPVHSKSLTAQYFPNAIRRDAVAQAGAAPG
jgi:uncharacterized protein with von Willebrand factor type A (vWA) domain